MLLDAKRQGRCGQGKVGSCERHVVEHPRPRMGGNRPYEEQGQSGCCSAFLRAESHQAKQQTGCTGAFRRCTWTSAILLSTHLGRRKSVIVAYRLAAAVTRVTRTYALDKMGTRA